MGACMIGGLFLMIGRLSVNTITHVCSLSLEYSFAKLLPLFLSLMFVY